MRKDQPKIKKEIKDLKAEVKLLKRKLEHRESVINYLDQVNLGLNQDILVFNIECRRLAEGRPALTQPFATKIKLAAEVNAL